MNAQQATDLLRTCLREVAPEADLDMVSPDADYREQLALDSLDFLRLVELLSQRGGIRIDEADYQRMSTISATIEFLSGTFGPVGAAAEPRK